MRYGLALPTGGECGDPRFLVGLAERAEAAGWDGIFREGYVLYQGDPTAPTCPTWPVLAAVAVRTSRLVLGVEVTPLARRRPWNVAREVAAVDQLCEGRAVLGVGLGDVGDHVVADASFTHFGEERDPRRRAERLDEALDIVAGLWTGEPFSYRGKHFTVDEVTFLPRPVQQPRRPSGSAEAIRTAGRSSGHCAGTAPASTTPGAARCRRRPLPTSAHAPAIGRGRSPPAAALDATTGPPSVSTSPPSATLAPTGGSSGQSPPIARRCAASATAGRYASAEQPPAEFTPTG